MKKLAEESLKVIRKRARERRRLGGRVVKETWSTYGYVVTPAAPTSSGFSLQPPGADDHYYISMH